MSTSNHLRLGLDESATSLPRVRAWFQSQVWALTREMYGVLCEVVERRLSGVRLSAEELAEISAGPKPQAVVSSGVAIVPVHGVIAHRMNAMQDISGGTSTQAIARDLRVALADSSVGAVLLDVDSPGGSVLGIQELAAELLAARDQKPIVAHVNANALSAAYWLASQASEIVVTPSGSVGSIGVFAEHVDESGLQDKLGMKTTLISAGKYKVEGNPYGPLEDGARAAMQERVDAIYQTFVKDVARGRGVAVDAVRNGFGEGRMVAAKDAVSQGMADRVDTFEATLRRLQTPQGRAAAQRAETDWRLRAELALLDL